jgi:hypothetical protein
VQVETEGEKTVRVQNVQGEVLLHTWMHTRVGETHKKHLLTQHTVRQSLDFFFFFLVALGFELKA